MKMLNIPYNNYKTQRCKYFDEHGVCKFGKNCSYAHGDSELRNPYDNLPVPPIFGQPMGMLGDGQGGFDMFSGQPTQGMFGQD